MASTPEKLVKNRIRAMLDKHGVYYAMPMGTGYGNSGVPDFLCCHNGFFLAIEAKAGKGKTTALQDANIERIRANKGVALVINETTMHLLEHTLQAMEDIYGG
jgi:Holliday junction resolvase